MRIRIMCTGTEPEKRNFTELRELGTERNGFGNFPVSLHILHWYSFECDLICYFNEYFCLNCLLHLLHLNNLFDGIITIFVLFFLFFLFLVIDFLNYSYFPLLYKLALLVLFCNWLIFILFDCILSFNSYIIWLNT